MTTPTIRIFTASSIFDFPNQRAVIGNLTRQINDRLICLKSCCPLHRCDKR